MSQSTIRRVLPRGLLPRLSRTHLHMQGIRSGRIPGTPPPVCIKRTRHLSQNSHPRKSNTQLLCMPSTVTHGAFPCMLDRRLPPLHPPSRRILLRRPDTDSLQSMWCNVHRLDKVSQGPQGERVGRWEKARNDQYPRDRQFQGPGSSSRCDARPRIPSKRTAQA